MNEGMASMSTASAAKSGASQVIMGSSSSPAKRKNEDDSEETSLDSESANQNQNSAKKEQISHGKAKREERRRKKEEKRILKELRRKEKSKREELKKKRGRGSDDQQELSTNTESVKLGETRGSDNPVVASKPIKKRKVTRTDNVAVEDNSDPVTQDLSPGNEGKDEDSDEDLVDSRRPTTSDADSSETGETIEDKAPPTGGKGRSRRSISNRHKPRTWNERLEDLANFKVEHGHTNVPSRNFYDRGLAEFVAQIKNNPDELNGEQKDKLRDLGFDWTTAKDKKEQAWDENLNLLEEYYKNHRNFEIHKIPELKKLYAWLMWQRSLQRSGRLRDDRKERLEGIGYTDWDPKTKKKSEDEIPNTWMKQYHDLKIFFRKKGHSMVPQHKHTEKHKDRTLGNWVRTQRRLRNEDCLSAKKIDLLEKLNFVWTFDSNDTSLRSGKLMDQRKEFDTSLDLLRQYKEEHGSIDDVRGTMIVQGRNLGKWLKNQKSLFRTGALSKDRKVRLEKVGVIFDII